MFLFRLRPSTMQARRPVQASAPSTCSVWKIKTGVSTNDIWRKIFGVKLDITRAGERQAIEDRRGKRRRQKSREASARNAGSGSAELGITRLAHRGEIPAPIKP